MHVVHLTLGHSHTNYLMTRGRQRTWRATAGHVFSLPVDERQHTLLIDAPSGYESFLLLIPRSYLQLPQATHECDSYPGGLRFAWDDDHILRSCMHRLFLATADKREITDRTVDEDARRLVRRLIELHGGVLPNWQNDGGTFDRHTASALIKYIDEHFRTPPSLGELSVHVGLSSSHFAKKFRLSFGLSLQRFINRRRVIHVLQDLLADSTCPSSVALDLGFSSQSHFTRIFSRLTGMTPARYRRDRMLPSDSVRPSRFDRPVPPGSCIVRHESLP